MPASEKRPAFLHSLKILKKPKYGGLLGVCPNPFRKYFINCVPVEEKVNNGKATVDERCFWVEA